MAPIRMRIINPAAIPPIIVGSNPASILADRIRKPERLYFVQGVLLTAYMLYPNNEDRRDQFVASEEPVRQQLLAYTGKEDPTFFDRFGGIASVGAAARELLLPEAESISETQWPRVGRLFRTVASMAANNGVSRLRGGASLEKAYLLLGEEAPRYQRSSLVRAWKEFSDVAHFMAATDFLVEESNRILDKEARCRWLDPPFMAPEAVIRVSLAFQRFGLQHRALRKGRSLLNFETMWRVPETNQEPDIPLPYHPLSPEQTRLLVERFGSR